MAYLVNSAPIAWPLGILAAVGRFFQWAFLGLSAAANYDTRMKEIEILQNKSDEDLEKLGLKRDEIVSYVYRDLFYV